MTYIALHSSMAKLSDSQRVIQLSFVFLYIPVWLNYQ